MSAPRWWPTTVWQWVVALAFIGAVQFSFVWAIILTVDLVRAGQLKLGDLIGSVIWFVLIVSFVVSNWRLESRVRKLERARPPEGTATAATRDLLASYELAGFTETEARELVKEAARLNLKQAGGWQP